MTLSEKLYQTIKDFPESLIAEVLDFAEFLKRKRQTEKIENAGGETQSLFVAGAPRPHSVSKLRFLKVLSPLLPLIIPSFSDT